MLSESRKRIDVVYSLLLSLYVLVPSVNKIAMVYFSFLHFSLMSLLYAITGVLIIVCFLIDRSKFKEIKKINICIFVVTLLYFLASSFLGVTKISIFEFIVYFALPILFFSRKSFSFSTLVKATLITSALGLPVVNYIFVLGYGGMAEMGVSYAFLLPSIIPIYYLMRYRQKTLIFLTLSIINLTYDIQILLHGSRGCAISILLAFLVLLAFKPSKRNLDRKVKIRLFVISTLILVVVLNFNHIINLTSQVLSIFGMSSNSLDKMITLSKSGDISNGRSEIFATAFVGFLNRPLFGNGFDSFDYYTGLEYPHNFIIQLLYDLGLFGFAFIFIPLIFGAIGLLKKSPKNHLYLFLVVFCSSVPGALFSQNAWKNVLLWITISMAVSYFGIRKVSVTYDKKNHEKAVIS